MSYIWSFLVEYNGQHSPIFPSGNDGAGKGGLVWTLPVFGVLARFTAREPKFVDKYVDPEDLGYYTSTNYTLHMHNSDYVLKNFCPDPVVKHKHKKADKNVSLQYQIFTSVVL